MNAKIKTSICTFIVLGFFLMLTNSCRKKKKDIPAPLQTGKVTDIDGNVYQTVKIGNQWWMSENLKVTKCQNGSLIRQVPNFQNTMWDTIKSGAWCMYDDNQNAPGFLYNGYAISDTNNIAPSGWHVPSDDEWKTLEEYLGMSQADANQAGWRGTHEGEKLKIEDAWTLYGTIWDTNESGFTALAGSCRIYNGTWGDPGLFATGFWWSTTQYQGNEAWFRYLDYKNANVFRSHVQKNYGFSVRCVKN